MKIDIIYFKFFNLDLQEPMALITNWMIAILSIYSFFKLKEGTNKEFTYWRRFFLFFFFTSFFAGLGHLFFKYFGTQGKYPHWTFSVIAGYYSGMGITSVLKDSKKVTRWQLFLISKAIILLISSIISNKFVFVATDAIITYIIFCGFMAYKLYKEGEKDLKYMIYGVLICIPSIFIFFFNINLHKWLNKEDLSHLLMFCCILFFYIGVKKRAEISKHINTNKIALS